MTATVAERRKQAGQQGESRNARLSEFNRRKRPKAVTRHEADRLYEPYARFACAGAGRLYRLNALGMLAIVAPGGEPLTQGEAHEAILDALYGPCIPE